MKSSDHHEATARGVSVQTLLASEQGRWELEVIAGRRGLSRRIAVPRVQKPGLALAGYVKQLHPDRVQIIGTPELAYLKELTPTAARVAIERVCRAPVACVVVTNGAEVPAVLRRGADRYRVPLLRTQLKTSVLIRALTAWLEEQLAPRETLIGALVQVFGVGVLLLGKSGIGKSEAALDLLMRGHRFVADDVVEVAEVLPRQLQGRSPSLVRHHMEIRGLGVVNINQLFGALATVDEQSIDLVIELSEWGDEIDPLGVDDMFQTILGVRVPLVRLPVSPGRNLATLIEVAARNHILKARGQHSAREFAAAVDREIRRGSRAQGEGSR